MSAFNPFLTNVPMVVLAKYVRQVAGVRVETAPDAVKRVWVRVPGAATGDTQAQEIMATGVRRIPNPLGHDRLKPFKDAT